MSLLLVVPSLTTNKTPERSLRFPKVPPLKVAESMFTPGLSEPKSLGLEEYLRANRSGLVFLSRSTTSIEKPEQPSVRSLIQLGRQLATDRPLPPRAVYLHEQRSVVRYMHLPSLVHMQMQSKLRILRKMVRVATPLPTTIRSTVSLCQACLAKLNPPKTPSLKRQVPVWRSPLPWPSIISKIEHRHPLPTLTFRQMPSM